MNQSHYSGTDSGVEPPGSNRGVGNDKTVFIIRGLPGSGKSALAESLVSSIKQKYGSIRIRIVSENFYFEHPDGTFKFEKMNIGRARSACLSSFVDGLRDGFQKIIVDNIHSEIWEYMNFAKLARAYDYQVIILEINCPDQKCALAFHARNTHAIPVSACINLYLRWERDPEAKVLHPWMPTPPKSKIESKARTGRHVDNPRAYHYSAGSESESSRSTSRSSKSRSSRSDTWGENYREYSQSHSSSYMGYRENSRSKSSTNSSSEKEEETEKMFQGRKKEVFIHGHDVEPNTGVSPFALYDMSN